MEQVNTAVLTIRVPEGLHSQLRELAYRERSSMNREAIIALRAHLDAQGKGVSK